MPIKQQDKCYRVINGQRLVNYCDLIMSEEENEKVIAEAKLAYKTVRKVKNASGGYYHLFVSENKPIMAEFINVGRWNINKTILVKDVPTLHKEIGKLLASKGWGIEETETPNKWQISAGYSIAGHVIIHSDPI